MVRRALGTDLGLGIRLVRAFEALNGELLLGTYVQGFSSTFKRFRGFSMIFGGVLKDLKGRSPLF